MTDAAKVPEKDCPPKVFCIDCKWHERLSKVTYVSMTNPAPPNEYTHLCRFGPQYETSYVTREQKPVRVHCHLKNPGGECEDYADFYTPGCGDCDRYKAEGTRHFPPHTASDRCESGKKAHCACDVCF